MGKEHINVFKSRAKNKRFAAEVKAGKGRCRIVNFGQKRKSGSEKVTSLDGASAQKRKAYLARAGGFSNSPHTAAGLAKRFGWPPRAHSTSKAFTVTSGNVVFHYKPQFAPKRCKNKK